MMDLNQALSSVEIDLGSIKALLAEVPNAYDIENPALHLAMVEGASALAERAADLLEAVSARTAEVLARPPRGDRVSYMELPHGEPEGEPEGDAPPFKPATYPASKLKGEPK